MDDDLLLEEQLKKKKRAVLLLLLSLLLVTAGAALLLEPTPLPSTAVARVETPSSTRPVAPLATGTHSEFQGDEWTQPTSPVSEDSRVTLPVASPTATSTENPRTTTATRQTNTPTATKMVNQEGTESSPAATSDGNDETKTSPTPTIAPGGGTTTAGAIPTTDSGTFVTTPSVESSVEVEGSDTGASTGETAPAATEISKRINESWDVLDEYDSISGNEINVSMTVIVTKTLTDTANLSETVAALPPDGLPITGIIPPGRINWAAVVMVILLIGTGVIALLYPKRLDT
jgi:hypothetical protein